MGKKWKCQNPNCGHDFRWHDRHGCMKGGCSCKMYEVAHHD